MIAATNRCSAFSNSGEGAWKFSETIIINNPGTGLEDYQVFISSAVINTGKLVGDNVLLPGLDDLRFMSNNKTELPCWIEKDSGTASGIWVRVPEIMPSSSTVSTALTMYYNNPAAAGISNPRETFLIYDDFNNLEQWKVVRGGWEIVNATLCSSAEGVNTIKFIKKFNQTGVHIKFNAANNGSGYISVEWKKNRNDSFCVKWSTCGACFTVTKASLQVRTVPIPASDTSKIMNYEIFDCGNEVAVTAGTTCAVIPCPADKTTGDGFFISCAGETSFHNLLVRGFSKPEPVPVIDRTVTLLPPYNLECEGEPAPQAVVDAAPEFSWEFSCSGGYPYERLNQQAYRIIVSTGLQSIMNDTGTSWDTGKVAGAEYAEYGGKELDEGATYFWRVSSWLNDALPPMHSAASCFHTSGNSAPDKPFNLLCNGETNPGNVSIIRPVLTWIFSDPDKGSSQKSYRILVSSGMNMPAPGTGDWWDSAPVESTAAAAVYSGKALVPDTTYYWKVMTGDDGGKQSPYSEAGSFFFFYDPARYPSGVKNLSATPLNGRKIKLQWNDSDSPDLAGYRVTLSSSAKDASPRAYEETVKAESCEWTSCVLEEGEMYGFTVRAFNEGGYVENNKNIVTAVARAKPSWHDKLLFSNPAAGRKVSGNRVSLTAKTGEMDSKSAGSLRFEYKKPGSAEWLAAGEAFRIADRNEYACYWNTEQLEDGIYFLRNTASAACGKNGTQRPYMTVTVDHKNPEVKEYDDGILSCKKEIIYNSLNNALLFFSHRNNNLIEITIPENSIAGRESVLTVTDAADTEDAGLPDGITYRGCFFEISLEPVELNGTALVKVPYSDDDGNGVVDKTEPPVMAADLKALLLDENGRTCEEIGDSRVNTETKQMEFKTNKLAAFCLSGKGLQTLKNPFNYPNPFGESGTTFIYELAENSYVTIRIYTTAYRLIKILLDNQPRNTGVHEEFWDGCDDGNPPARLSNGQYFYKIISSDISGSKTIEKTRNLTIMR